MPLNIESDSKGGNRTMALKLAEMLADVTVLDQKPLTDFLAE